MAAAAAATHLGASSCFGVRPSQVIHGVGNDGGPRTSFRNRLSFDRSFQRASPQRLFHCVAEDASEDPPPAPKPAAKPAAKPAPKNVLPKRPTFTMKKGQIVRVDKEKYLNSIEYYAVNHPKFYKGIDYIYEDRGEVLDLRNFEAGEYALLSWAGIPSAPAWLPTYMLIESEKLSYKRT